MNLTLQPSGQGITGFIYRQQGNQMPRKGGYRPHIGKGVTSQIAIYAAIRAENTPHTGTLFLLDAARPLATGISDSTGKFRISLPPGSYSVFIKINNGWYADETDGNGYVNHILIYRGQWLERNFIKSEGGAY